VALKTKLEITTEQEPAWSSFASRTAPETRMAQRADREHWAKLTTPERLDKMQARQNERAATTTRNLDATRSLYSAVSPEQQKLFDIQAQTHFQRTDMHGEHRHGGHGLKQQRS
jgi:hypothetical protein